METKPLPETIAGLEKIGSWIQASDKRTYEHVAIVESALAHLRSQEETVRRVALEDAEICKARDKPGLHPWIRSEAHECAAAILAAHGLKEKT